MLRDRRSNLLFTVKDPVVAMPLIPDGLPDELAVRAEDLRFHMARSGGVIIGENGDGFGRHDPARRGGGNLGLKGGKVGEGVPVRGVGPVEKYPKRQARGLRKLKLQRLFLPGTVDQQKGESSPAGQDGAAAEERIIRNGLQDLGIPLQVTDDRAKGKVMRARSKRAVLLPFQEAPFVVADAVGPA